MKTYFFFFRLAENRARFLLLFLSLSLLSSVFGVLNLALLKPLLDTLFGLSVSRSLAITDSSNIRFELFFQQLIEQKGPKETLQLVCGFLVFSAFCASLFRYFATWYLESYKLSFGAVLREKFLQQTLYLPISYFSEIPKSTPISLFSSDIQEIESVMSALISACIKEGSLLIGYLMVLLYISPTWTLTSLFMIPLVGGFLGLVLKKLREKAHQNQQYVARLLGILDESIAGIRILKSFSAYSFVQKRFAQENKVQLRLARQFARRNLLANPFSEWIGISMVASILYLGGSRILSGETDLSASSFIAFLAIFSQIIRPAKDISQAISTAQKGLVAAQRVHAFFMLPTEELHAKKDKSIPFQEKITFESVYFSYPSSEYVLKNITFSLMKGQTVALVGPSGSGKSTLVDLLLRFHSPHSGTIFVDGKPTDSFDLQSYRSLFGLVQQDSFLFDDTIYANITLGENSSKEAVLQAATIADAHAFIEQQPAGYQTKVGNRGGRLSGGQRQRIALARAMLQQTSVLVLDEATSSLDAQSEWLIREGLKEILKEKTTLIIAHRLATVQEADVILVMHHGEIIEQGNHVSLMEKKGVYAQMVEKQVFTKE